MSQFSQKLKDEIGREKFILMDNYSNIEALACSYNQITIFKLK
jgi:hypothetical protein